jgi:phosphoglycolate phosphatase
MSATPSCRNVIFDLDGTLIDSKPGIVAGLRHALRRMGHELPAGAALDWAIGPPLVDALAAILRPLGDDRAEEAARHYRAWYGETGLFDATVYPGIPDLLDRLTQRGLTLFVGTAKRTDFARRVLDHFGLARHFRAVYGSQEPGRFDRKALLLHHVLQVEGLSVTETVVVGDREHDVIAARANGLRMIAVTYGYGSREELCSAGPVEWADRAAEVGRLLGVPSSLVSPTAGGETGGREGPAPRSRTGPEGERS